MYAFGTVALYYNMIDLFDERFAAGKCIIVAALQTDERYELFGVTVLPTCQN